jgi:hypothetical protein
MYVAEGGNCCNDGQKLSYNSNRNESKYFFFFYHIGLKVIQRQNRVFTFIGVVQTVGVDICNPQIILDACNANTSSFLKVISIKKGR